MDEYPLGDLREEIAFVALRMDGMVSSRWLESVKWQVLSSLYGFGPML
jgi:hypothetical protein